MHYSTGEEGKRGGHSYAQPQQGYCRHAAMVQLLLSCHVGYHGCMAPANRVDRSAGYGSMMPANRVNTPAGYGSMVPANRAGR